jgi:hypothetical protein
MTGRVDLHAYYTPETTATNLNNILVMKEEEGRSRVY